MATLPADVELQVPLTSEDAGDSEANEMQAMKDVVAGKKRGASQDANKGDGEIPAEEAEVGDELNPDQFQILVRPKVEQPLWRWILSLVGVVAWLGLFLVIVTSSHPGAVEGRQPFIARESPGSEAAFSETRAAQTYKELKFLARLPFIRPTTLNSSTPNSTVANTPLMGRMAFSVAADATVELLEAVVAKLNSSCASHSVLQWRITEDVGTFVGQDGTVRSYDKLRNLEVRLEPLELFEARQEAIALALNETLEAARLANETAATTQGAGAHPRQLQALRAARREAGREASEAAARGFETQLSKRGKKGDDDDAISSGEPDHILFVSHYDTAAGSGGAGSGSLVGPSVSIELLRNLCHADEALPKAVVFLFAEGGEAGHSGAHAFVTESEFASEVAVFIAIDAEGREGMMSLVEVGPNNNRLVDAFYNSVTAPLGFSTTADFISAGKLGWSTAFNTMTAAGAMGMQFMPIEFPSTRRATDQNPKDGYLQSTGALLTSLLAGLMDVEELTLDQDEGSPAIFYGFYGGMLKYPQLFAGFLVAFNLILLGGVLIIAVNATPGGFNDGWAVMYPFFLSTLVCGAAWGVGMLFAVLAACVVSAVDSSAFTDSYLAAALYGSWTLFGLCVGSFALEPVLRWAFSHRSHAGTFQRFTTELYCHGSTLFLFWIMQIVLGILEIASSYHFFIWITWSLVPVFVVALSMNGCCCLGEKIESNLLPKEGHAWPVLYMLWTWFPLLVSLPGMGLTFELFAQDILATQPGQTMMAELNYACLSALMLGVVLLPIMGVVHRAGHKLKTTALIAIWAIVCLVVAATRPSAYSTDIPRRINLLHFAEDGGKSFVSVNALGPGTLDSLKAGFASNSIVNNLAPCKVGQSLGPNMAYVTVGLCLEAEVENIEMPTLTVLANETVVNATTGLTDFALVLDGKGAANIWLGFDKPLGAWDLGELPWSEPETFAVDGPLQGMYVVQHSGRGALEMVVEMEGDASALDGIKVQVYASHHVATPELETLMESVGASMAAYPSSDSRQVPGSVGPVLLHTEITL